MTAESSHLTQMSRRDVQRNMYTLLLGISDTVSTDEHKKSKCLCHRNVEKFSVPQIFKNNASWSTRCILEWHTRAVFWVNRVGKYNSASSRHISLRFSIPLVDQKLCINTCTDDAMKPCVSYSGTLFKLPYFLLSLGGRLKGNSNACSYTFSECYGDPDYGVLINVDHRFKTYTF